jgi:hypothetical protein
VVDVFEEVDEQLRSDQFRTFMQKGLPGMLGGLAAVLLIVLGFWGYTSYRQAQAEKASAAYAAGADKLAAGDSNAAFAQFDVAAKAGSGVYKSLALQQEGAIRLGQNKIPEAVALFDQAASAAPDQFVGDVARLKSAQALLDTASYADIEKRLTPLTDPQRPLSAMAKETLAFAKLKAGMTKQARADFVVLSLLPAATDDMRQRAHAAIALIDDGSAAQLNATVKAAQDVANNPLFPEGPPQLGPAPTNTPQPEAAQ